MNYKYHEGRQKVAFFLRFRSRFYRESHMLSTSFSSEQMTVCLALLCGPNSQEELKKTTTKLFQLNDVNYIEVFDVLIEKGWLLQQGDNVYFSAEGLVQSLLEFGHEESIAVDTLLETNTGKCNAPYATLFAFIAGFDRVINEHKLAVLCETLLPPIALLCSSPRSWQLNNHIDMDAFPQIIMINWFNLLMTRPSLIEFNSASQALKEWQINQFEVNFSSDKWCFTKKINTEHILASSSFDSTYLNQRQSSLLLKLNKISFTQLCDLALVSVLDPSLLPALKMDLKQAFYRGYSSYFWQQSIDFITSGDEVLVSTFSDPKKWLSSLTNEQGQVAWGKVFIDAILAYRLRENIEIWIRLMAMTKHSEYQRLLDHKDNFALAQLAKNALLRLVDQEYPLVHVASPWQLWLTQMDNVLNPRATKKARLIWQLNSLASTVEAKIQAKGKRGWSKGRKIPLSQFNYQYQELLNQSDKNILSAASYHGMGWDGEAQMTKSVANALCEADNLYDHQGEQVSFYREIPLLVWRASDEMLAFNVYPCYKKKNINPSWLHNTHDSIFRFIDAPEPLTKFLDELQHRDPHFPSDKKTELISVLGEHVRWFDVDSQKGTVTRDEWLPDPQLWLAWNGTSLDVSIEHCSKNFRVSRLSGGGNEWVSGSDGVWYQRDLIQEKQQALSLAIDLDLCKSPSFTWQMQGEEALAFMSKLDTKTDLNLHWKANSQQVKVIGVEHFSMSINQKQNWFEVDGRVHIDSSLEMDLRQLLAHHRSGFINSESSAITLLISEQLRRQLSLLDSLVNENLLVEQRMAYPLKKLVESMSSNSDDAWNALVEEWRIVPTLDVNLLLPLRDYQKECVEWAAHLSQHGFGACLADDMGLGKTLQALTLLSHYQHKGPSLVVCPKSVLTNWKEEAKRFTPQLVMIDLESSPDRITTITEAGPNDVVLLSYGLVTRLASELNEVEWNCTVLDEAQQIKNPQAKRSKVVFGLQATRRFALSGTPVENHLVELWSLFSFLNPGLLGDLKSFRSKYAQAAKKAEDMLRLKALVSPFIMRRLKSEVLTELPAKTEIIHHVELSNKERTAYEAVRKESLANLRSPTSRGVVEVFVALTKLRQICCDVGLVFEHLQNETSSKLSEVQWLIEEALTGDHKVLVFSQFVGVLKRFSSQLTASNIPFSYLDGKLTTKQRQSAIDAFKDGTNSVFLISLKAGGTGLNLTEADTVIHIDPWWNPAVEDQASDRAYRMGQQKPVTVYRLVTTDTIEEKIIALHHDKRDLAAQVLSGSSSCQTLDPQQLLGLLEES